jgi:hypothetical protein
MGKVAHIFQTECLSRKQMFRSSLVSGIRMRVDRTLSSLTLLEEELGFPFFGGMASLGESGGLDYGGWGGLC